ncbi:MAG TPA: helix-turn-helix transcriptional regulator [Actinophytocola sp.]|uniref:helix-turn-helix domain-containing protein n=1 Tax=Actinophytocola sp. TaxID=1872138 RepID=UPI002DB61582|nr:helix-turn-helix transcriptional regulator [Actinophytocola sp.]HEU5475121.1 helix-turn-helix transcriptional regulator [Actinophytocola sp.]
MKKEPQARDRIIGARVRAIRTERVGLSLERAAEIAQWPPAKLSRTERGLRHVTIEEVATLLTAWQLPGGEREQVLEEIQVGSSSGWWDRPIPGVPQEVGALASYEADAYELVSVAVTAVPGLLHTYETAVAVMAADGVPAEDIETRWMARLRRQQIVMKIVYRAFISEIALRTPFGGRAALRGQLEHLLTVQSRGVDVRVIPAHQTAVFVLHPFLLMRFRSTAPVIHVELAGLAGAFYVHDKDVANFESLLDRLDHVALSRGASSTIITDLMERLEHD